MNPFAPPPGAAFAPQSHHQSHANHSSTASNSHNPHKRRAEEHKHGAYYESEQKSMTISSVPGLGLGSASPSQSAADPSQSSSRPRLNPLTDPYPWAPRQVTIYRRTERLTLIGEGTYGSVFLAKSPRDELVALKKIRKEKKEGFPITAIREIKILKKVNHPNIIKLKDVVSSHSYTSNAFKEGDVFMVFEFMDHDLTGLLEARVVMSDAQIKYYLRSILEGLHYLHANKIIHRDIKGANILISNNGDIKIADFGLARLMKSSGQGSYTNRVVTLWYRAPELLLGMTEYDTAIDLWSLGCLFAELLCRGAVLFPGNNTELDQLNKIYALCGSPAEDNWPNVSKLKYFPQITPVKQPRRLREEFATYRRANPQLSSRLTDSAIDLLDKLLVLNPKQRLTAKQALEHEYFTREHPAVMRKDEHPVYQQNYHEFHSKRRKEGRQREKQAQQQQQQSQPQPQSTQPNLPSQSLGQPPQQQSSQSNRGQQRR